jgi:hypothetical protein
MRTPLQRDAKVKTVASKNAEVAVSVLQKLTGGKAAGSAAKADFQQTAVADDRFLQIVAKAEPKKRQHKLTRVAFRVSRLMEFCSLRELQNQTGHQVFDWPIVVAKELIDNALDACEEAEIAPVIAVAVRPGEIVVQDNGTGIAEETVRSIRDYSIRVSSREAYVSPSRGAQGNALKTLLAMGYVLDRERDEDNADAVGTTIIETRGTAHKIEFRVDHVTNEPRIIHTTTGSAITIGTRVTIRWPRQPLYEGYKPLLEGAETQFKTFVGDYTWINPHLSLRGTWNEEVFVDAQASNPAGSSGDPGIRPARTGTARRACSATSRPTWPATGSLGRIVRFGSSSPSSAG